MPVQTQEKTIAYRRKTAVQRREELIKAGIVCLGKGGLSGFTIDQICREAGVSRGLINHHFRTKDELLVQIYSEMTAHLVYAPDAGSGIAQLAQIIQVSFDERTFNQSNLRAWLAIWAEVANHAALNALHRKRYRDYRQRIVAALRSVAVAQGLELEVASIARQMIALIDGLWLEYCLHAESFTLAEARRDCFRLLRAYAVELEE